MRSVSLAAAAILAFPSLPAQEEDFRVYSEAPRLLLGKQRLRLLQRERERRSARWERFASLVEGGAPMPEPGFAYALHYRVSENPASGRKALDWALGAGTDLRQLALVFDWCGPLMSRAQSESLGAKIERALAASPAAGVRVHSARVLAAIAIADRLPDQGQPVLRETVERWWRKEIVPALRAGRPLPRSDTYWLFEMMHALQDNLRIELRESAGGHFKQFTVDHLVGHYPAPYPAAENLYRIPVYAHQGEPDLTQAALSRAAGLAMVAYDNNALDSQYLQGWLMQDPFTMRGALGGVYEFLWANPYQPGLSYFHLPLLFHDAATGHVFARTSWDDDATWIGFFDGRLQLFRNGQVQMLKPGASVPPVRVGGAVLMTAPAGEPIRATIDSEALFLLGLQPGTSYEVEIDDQEMTELETDAGGTLVISVPADLRSHARIRPSATQSAAR